MIRSFLGAGALSLLVVPAAVAQCQHLYDAVVIDGAGKVDMVVVPTCDQELGDPAYNQPGMTQVWIHHETDVDPIVAAAKVSKLVSTSLATAASVSVSSSISQAAAAAATAVEMIP